MAVLKSLKKDSRQSRQGKRGRQDAQICRDGPWDSRRVDPREGGAVQAQGPRRHLRDGDDVGDLAQAHPPVGHDLVGDQGDHGQAAEAGKADLDKAPKQLKKGQNHGGPSPFSHSIHRSECR